MSTNLGDICCFVGLHYGAMADSKIWSKDVPWQFMMFWEVCLADCAYSSRPCVVAPFWKPHGRSMGGQAQAYNEVHSFYRARAEHLFSLFAPFGLVCHCWGGRDEPAFMNRCHRLRVLTGFISFPLHRRMRYEPYGPWPHNPPSVAPAPAQAPAPTPSPNRRTNEAGQNVATDATDLDAVVDEWQSDDEPEQPCYVRQTRSAAKDSLWGIWNAPVDGASSNSQV